MKVAVSAGAGFIGANLCRVPLGHPRNTEVLAFDGLAMGPKENLDAMEVSMEIVRMLGRQELEQLFMGSGWHQTFGFPVLTSRFIRMYGRDHPTTALIPLLLDAAP